MANQIKFKLKNEPLQVSAQFIRVEDSIGSVVFSGEELTTDAEGNAVVDIGTGGVVGEGVYYFGDNRVSATPETFKSFAGYTLVEEFVDPSVRYYSTLNGTSSRYNLTTHFTPTGGFTIRFGFRSTIDVSVRGILSTVNSDNGILIFLDSATGNVVAKIDSGTYDLRITKQGTFNDGEWHTGELIFEPVGDLYSISVDGSPVITGTNTGVDHTFVTAGCNDKNGTFSSFFSGDVANLELIDDTDNANNQTYALDLATGDIETSEEGVNTIEYVNIPDASRAEGPVYESGFSRPGLRTIHVLGDSFTTSTFVDQMDLQLADEQPNTTKDGLGGSTLIEQADRFDLTPQHYDKVLVIMDGGLSDNATNAIIAIDRMIANLPHTQWVYVQASPQQYVDGNSLRDAWNETQDAILTKYGADHYVECLTAMQAGNDGSAQDLQDVADNIVPDSLRVDIVHETEAGTVIRVGEVVSHIEALGW